MKKTFKVEIRKNCKICGGKLPTNRCRTYCSTKCRNRFYNKKNYKKQLEWYRNKRGKFEEGKIRCLICGKWYRQLGSHVVQKHKMTAREYRKKFGYDVKSGRSILSKDLHELYGKQAKENGTEKNLKAGKKFRFVPGDKRAGKYERSEETMERLKKLHLLTNNKKNVKTIQNRVR